MAGLSVLLVLFFAIFPGIDTAFSGLFFQPSPCPDGTPPETVCGLFWPEQFRALGLVRQVLHYLPIAAASVLALLLFVRLGRWRIWRDRFNLAITALLTGLALGPGVLVNLILKEYSGRPRPRDTEIFAGDKPFVPVGEVSSHCDGNCSFVSGEASGAFWLVCLAALLPAALRPAAFAVLGTVALCTALLRVMFGAHYLSDVLIAGALTITMTCLAAVAIRRLLPYGDATGQRLSD